MKKMWKTVVMKRVFGLAAAFLMLATVAAAAAACAQKDALKVEFIDKFYRPELFLGVEYDVADIIKKEDGVKYSASGFYLDKNFEAVDIQFNGTKFTQKAFFDVIVTVTAKKGGSVGSNDVNIEIQVDADEMSVKIRNSWAEDGVSKTFSASPEYLRPGSTCSVKVAYNDAVDWAALNEAASYLSSRGDYFVSSYSCTDWTNAVVSYWIYNPNDFPLTAGNVIAFRPAPGSGKTEWVRWFAEMPKYTCAPNAWTHIYYSYRALGIDYCFLSDGIDNLDYLKMRRADDGPSRGECSFTFYIDGYDVVNYSASLFPDLDTRSPEDKIPPVPDTREGKIIHALLTANNPVSEQSYCDKELIEWDNTIAASPDGENFGYALKVDGLPGRSMGTIADGFYKSELYPGVDWTDAVLTYWVYNPGLGRPEPGFNMIYIGHQFDYGGGDMGWTSWYSPPGDMPGIECEPGEWTQVTVSLKSLGIVQNPFVSGRYFRLATGNHTGDQHDDRYTIYIAGFDIVDNSLERDIMAAGKTGGVKKTLNVDAGYIYSGSVSSVKVEYTTDNQPWSWNQGPDYIRAGNGSSGDRYRLYDWFSTDWSDAVLTYWIYNDNNFALYAFHLIGDGTTMLLEGNQAMWAAVECAPHAWTQVVVSLGALGVNSNFLADSGDPCLNFRMRSSNPGGGNDNLQSFTFYICGLDIMDNCLDLDIAATGKSDGVKKSLNTDSAYIKSGVYSVKVEYNTASWTYAWSQGPDYVRTGDGSSDDRYKLYNWFSATDWDNAVLTYWVYNDNDFPLYAFPLIMSDGTTTVVEGNDAVYNYSDECAPNDWTQVVISLRALGINSNFLAAGGFVCLRITDGWGGADSMPRSYAFYISNLDITDYDISLFPGLDTTSPAEKREEAICNALTGTASSAFTTSVVKTSDTDINFSASGAPSAAFEYALEVVFAHDGSTDVKSYYASVPDSLLYSVTDWEDAVLTFWVYSDNDAAASWFYIGQTYNLDGVGSENGWGYTDWGVGGHAFYANHSGEINVSAGGSWHQVSVSLKALGIEENILANGGYIQMCAGIMATHKIGGGDFTFYITGFDIVNA